MLPVKVLVRRFHSLKVIVLIIHNRDDVVQHTVLKHHVCCFFHFLVAARNNRCEEALQYLCCVFACEFFSQQGCCFIGCFGSRWGTCNGFAALCFCDSPNTGRSNH